MPATITVLCSEEASGDIDGVLRDAGREFGVEFRRVVARGKARLPPAELATVDAAVCLFGETDLGAVFRNMLSKGATSLKAVFIGWVGLDGDWAQALRNRGVRLYNSPGVNAAGIAQTLVAGMLMIERRMGHFADAQRRRSWEGGRLPEALDSSRRDVAGLTAVLYGFGHIGAAAAPVLRALGMCVVGVRRSPAAPGDPVDEMVHPDQLLRVARRADWFINMVPLTDATRGAVTRDVIRALPRGAGFINVGRGKTVDEPALIDALRDGHLRGAYLDVFSTEPLPSDSPLWALPNVIVSPHNSSGAFGNRARSVEILRDNLRGWLAARARPPDAGAAPARL